MHRNIRSLMIVLAAGVVVAAACGDSSTDDTDVDNAVDSAQVSVTEPDSREAADGNAGSGPSTTVMPTSTAPAPSTTVSRPDDEPDPPVPDPSEKEPEPATSTTSPNDEVDPVPVAEDLDASALLPAAGEASVGQPVRGEFAVSMSPDTGAVLASATFETGVDGNTAMTFSLFGSISMEFRFVDGAAYVQLPPELLSSMGLGTTVPDPWLTVDEASAAELGVGCPSPLSFLDPEGSMSACNPLSDTAMLLPEFVDDATIVGRETLRGFETTVIRLTLSLQDLVGVSLESVADSENGRGDPEVLEEMFPSDTEIQADIWIDGDLRILRTVIDLGSLMPGFDGSDDEGFEDMPRLVSTTDYYDHGATIVVEAPLPEQVIGDLADLQGSAPGGY